MENIVKKHLNPDSCESTEIKEDSLGTTIGQGIPDKEFFKHDKKISRMFNELKKALDVETYVSGLDELDYYCSGGELSDEKKEEKAEVIKKAVSNIDFKEIEAALNSKYKYAFINSFSWFLNANINELKKQGLDSFLFQGLNNIIANNPEVLSLGEFYSNGATLEQSEFEASHVLTSGISSSQMCSKVLNLFFKFYIENKDSDALGSLIKIQNDNLKEGLKHRVDSEDYFLTTYEEDMFINKFSDDELKNMVVNAVKNIFSLLDEKKLRNSWHKKNNFTAKAMDLEANNFVKNKFPFMKNFDIELWRDHKGTDFIENIKVMDKLEEKSAGSVKLLYEEYGIIEFQRYPIELLLAQVEEEYFQQPYGLVIFPRDDHNGAFDNRKSLFEKLYLQTRGHCGIKIVECFSEIDIARKLITLDKKYSPENKIAFLILGGHGSGETLRLGEFNSKDRNVLSNEDADRSTFKRVNEEYLAKEAEIMFISCSAGQDNGIAEKYSSVFNKKTIASKIPFSNIDFNIIFDKNNKPHFSDAIFDEDAELTTEYNSKN